MAATAYYTVAGITAAYGAAESHQAQKEQKSSAKKADRNALLAKQEEQKKQLARQQGQQAGGYGSTLGAGASSLGG